MAYRTPKEVSVPFSSSDAEFLALANLSGIDAEKMAEAFNDPEHFFDHLSLEELRQFSDACVRVSALQSRMVAATDMYVAFARGLLEGTKAD